MSSFWGKSGAGSCAFFTEAVLSGSIWTATAGPYSPTVDRKSADIDLALT